MCSLHSVKPKTLPYCCPWVQGKCEVVNVCRLAFHPLDSPLPQLRVVDKRILVSLFKGIPFALHSQPTGNNLSNARVISLRATLCVFDRPKDPSQHLYLMPKLKFVDGREY